MSYRRGRRQISSRQKKKEKTAEPCNMRGANAPCRILHKKIRAGSAQSTKDNLCLYRSHLVNHCTLDRHNDTSKQHHGATRQTMKNENSLHALPIINTTRYHIRVALKIFYDLMVKVSRKIYMSTCRSHTRLKQRSKWQQLTTNRCTPPPR